MMICEICGRAIKGKGKEIYVEQAVLRVCNNCVRYGTPVKSRPQVKKRTSGFSAKQSDFEIREDYPEIVRKAREKIQLTQKDLAQKINEKESVIHRIETGHMRPSRKLARKLEGALDIHLLEKIEEHQITQRRNRSDELTIGDIIRIKKK
ncbi:MAG: TIGR00270 family protein [Theionarchaea archaeon]|nr:TIGR00270 family protein [Theionarchaea archaeon]